MVCFIALCVCSDSWVSRGSPFINVSNFNCTTVCLQCQWAVNRANSTGGMSSSALTSGTFVDSTTITCYSPPISKLLNTSDYPSTLLVDVSVTQNGQVWEVFLFLLNFISLIFLSDLHSKHLRVHH